MEEYNAAADPRFSEKMDAVKAFIGEESPATAEGGGELGRALRRSQVDKPGRDPDPPAA